jgi:hypothetical protein
MKRPVREVLKGEHFTFDFGLYRKLDGGRWKHIDGNITNEELTEDTVVEIRSPFWWQRVLVKHHEKAV